MKNYGITFNGITIHNNWDLQSEPYSLLDVSEPATPRLAYTEITVPKRDGSKRIGDRRENKQIDVVIEVRGDVATNTRLLLEKWAIGEGKLIFIKRPTLFYYAGIFEEVTKAEMPDGTYQLTVIFNASPFMYELYTDARDLITNETYGIITEDADGILTNTAIWQDITVSKFKQLVNTGNQATMPIIAITGTATRIAMTFDDVAFSFNGLSNETVFIDTEKMICYTVTGDKKVSKLTNFNGLFPPLKVGTSDIVISGTSFDVDIEVKYRNTYIV